MPLANYFQQASKIQQPTDDTINYFFIHFSLLLLISTLLCM